MTIGWARHFVTGLSSLRDRAAARLAALRFNPSRVHLARIASVRLESINGNPRHVRIVAVFLGRQEQIVAETYIPNAPFRVGGMVLPPIERNRKLW